MFSGQEAASDETKNVSTEKTRLVKNVASMYLDEKFSDVTFLVRGEQLPAHKAILAAESNCFEALFNANSGKKEITILNTSPEAFRHLLKFIYTDIITIPSNTELILQVLVLARQYSSKNLTCGMVQAIKLILDVKNVCAFLNGANNDDLDELRDACHSFMDDNVLQIISSDSFNDLTQESMIQILKRDSFVALKMAISKSIAKWCERNNTVDHLALECVRLSLLTASEIMSIVWPKVVSSKKFIKTVFEITGKNPSGLHPMGVLFTDENIATVQHGAEVVSTLLHTDGLLSGNRNVKKYVQHTINGENGIVIRLGQPYYVNHISMMLYDEDNRYYSYYIETSMDEKKWTRVVDYSRYACRSVQSLYFEKQVSQFIKIVGTSNSKGSHLRLVFFEAFYKSIMPDIVNSVIRPDKNVATPENKAVVIQGNKPCNLLNGKYDHQSSHFFKNEPKSLIVQLAQPYLLSSMTLLLGGTNESTWKYFIETSVNKTDWKIVIDRRNSKCKFWQDLHFAERVVVFIKITGTHSSNYYSCFFCNHFECSSEGKIIK